MTIPSFYSDFNINSTSRIILQNMLKEIIFSINILLQDVYCIIPTKMCIKFAPKSEYWELNMVHFGADVALQLRKTLKIAPLEGAVLAFFFTLNKIKYKFVVICLPNIMLLFNFLNRICYCSLQTKQ